MEEDIKLIRDELSRIQVLIRTNNLLLSRFILELSKVRKELGLPKRQFYFRFDLLEDEYEQLIEEFTKDEVDKALYYLDRLLLTNRQECPNNIAKYIRRKIKNNRHAKEMRRLHNSDDMHN